MSHEIAADAPTIIEHEIASSETSPVFSANLFAGPCFGDLSPSETLPDAPSPSPLLLNPFPDSDIASLLSAQAPETEDLIEFTDAQESTFDMSIPSSKPDCQKQIHEPSISLMDSSPNNYQEPLHPPSTSSLPLTSVSESSIDPTLQLDGSSKMSSPLIRTDEQSLVPDHPAPFNESLEKSDPTQRPNTEEKIFPSAELPMLDESYLHETTEPLAQTMTMDVAPNENTIAPPSSHLAGEPTSSPTLSLTEPIPVDVALNENANIFALPSSRSADEPTSSATLPLTENMPIANENKNVLVLPFSSPADEPTCSPALPTPPTHPSPQPSSDAIDPFPYLVSFPQTRDRSDASYPPATLYEPESFPTSSPPPSSSPEPIFSSSPPVASDSSSPPDDSPKPVNTHLPAVDTDFPPPSSSPPQHFAGMHESDSLNQDDFDAAPPSSSPMASSSPMYLPYTELPEQLSPPLNTEEVSNSLSPPDLVQRDNYSIDLLNPTLPTLVDSSVPLTGLKTDHVPTSHKRKREETREIIPQPPNPKRPTLASQKLQRKTLVKPFRSPAMIAPKAPEPTPPPPMPKKEPASVEQLPRDELKRHRTQRAAGQFKSPLPSALSASIPSAVRQTPTIQALERKVQVLRRAVKIKKDGEETILEGLVKKWTEAGREVAWEVWALIKDQDNGSGDDWGKDSQNATKFEDSWGWNEDSSSKRVKTERDDDRNWGWATGPTTDAGTDDRPTEQPMEPVETEKPRETLGTMLMRFGIAPSTLGWNDEEEEFVDD
ncbi:hypothetical protein B0H14DRAFT_2490847 [Mycena olivaceomarginata]|nr:hypothetical protein B0H14DRAFT_2490847 [Mycena olivaceomarginata]